MVDVFIVHRTYHCQFCRTLTSPRQATWPTTYKHTFARHDATARKYVYTVCNDRFRSFYAAELCTTTPGLSLAKCLNTKSAVKKFSLGPIAGTSIRRLIVTLSSAASAMVLLQDGEAYKITCGHIRAITSSTVTCVTAGLLTKQAW